MIYFIVFLAFLFTIFSGSLILKQVKPFNEFDCLEFIIAVFIIGLAFVLIPLLLVGILFESGFKLASYIILILALVLFVIGVTKYSLKRFLTSVKDTVINIRIVILLFLCKYAFMLSIKGIFDWDATSLYLPFARLIFQSDHIPLTYNGYQTVTLPMGQSVLYSWAYSLSGSIYTESFRLFPLLFVFINIVIIYKLSNEILSKEIASVAVIVYTMLPIHDADLWYATFYADPLYNVLILASFFFLYKYVRNKKTSYTLLGGLSLGLAALVKAQFLYLLPATAFVFCILLYNRILRKTFVLSISAGIVALFIFIVYPDPNFLLNLDPLTTILFFIFIFVLISLLFFNINRLNSHIVTIENQRKFIKILKDALGFYSTIGIVAAIWYLRNYFLTGTILWDNFFSSANYHWAQEFILSTMTSLPTNSTIPFFFYMIVIPFSSYALGTLFFVPKVVGLIKLSKEGKWFLLIFIWILGFWIGYFLANFYSFQTIKADPRQLYPLVPLLSIIIASGITSISDYLSKNNRKITISIILLSFGFISLSQSSLIYQYGPSFLKDFFSVASTSLGSSIEALAGKVPNYPQFLAFAAPELLIFSVIISFLILFPIFIPKIFEYIQKRLTKNYCHFSLHLRHSYPKKILFILFFSLLILPIFSMAFEYTNGNIDDFSEKQLGSIYDGLYTDISSYVQDNAKINDTILMINSNGFQYFLQKEINVLDISQPGNLAAVRNIIESDDFTQIIDALHKKNIRYVLLTKTNNALMKKIFNESMFLDVLQNPLYFSIVKTFDSWILYELIYGRYNITPVWVENFTANWTVIKGNPSLSNCSEPFSVTVPANTTITVQYSFLPRINTTTYPYLTYNITGSRNTQYLFRLFSDDEKLHADFPYWGIPSDKWKIKIYNLAESSIANSTLSHTAFLSVKSIDQFPAQLNVSSFTIFKYDEVN